MSRRLGRAQRLLLRVVLPRERREEFIGDLLEEAAFRAERGGHRAANRWLWQQVLASLPSLAIARVRRAHAPRALATTAGVPAVFITAPRFAPRSLALLLSTILHLGFFAALLVRGVWSVDELTFDPERIKVVFQIPGPPRDPVFGEKKPAREKTAAPENKSPRRGPPTPAPVPVVVAPGNDKPGDGDRDGADVGDRPATTECPIGVACGGSPLPPRVLPPHVGEKSCISCTPPHLPQAYQRLGASYAILVRICVDARGSVDSVKVLQGLGGAADQAVLGTVETWRFEPYRIDGRPVPFCYATRFVFTTTN